VFESATRIRFDLLTRVRQVLECQDAREFRWLMCISFSSFFFFFFFRCERASPTYPLREVDRWKKLRDQIAALEQELGSDRELRETEEGLEVEDD